MFNMLFVLFLMTAPMGSGNVFNDDPISASPDNTGPSPAGQTTRVVTVDVSGV